MLRTRYQERKQLALLVQLLGAVNLRQLFKTTITAIKCTVPRILLVCYATFVYLIRKRIPR